DPHRLRVSAEEGPIEVERADFLLLEHPAVPGVDLYRRVRPGLHDERLQPQPSGRLEPVGNTGKLRALDQGSEVALKRWIVHGKDGRLLRPSRKQRCNRTKPVPIQAEFGWRGFP